MPQQLELFAGEAEERLLEVVNTILRAAGHTLWSVLPAPAERERIATEFRCGRRGGSYLARATLASLLTESLDAESQARLERERQLWSQTFASAPRRPR